MTTNPSGFDPLWMFRAPWSGDVAQRITAPWFSPSLTVNYAGDPAVEDRVVTEVASYGINTQLLFDADGTLIQRRRKITPTYHERMIWGQGDGTGLRGVDSAVGRIGPS